MAQTLYREWFVKFRFPGHQKVKMVDSPLGKIPEGWEVKRLVMFARDYDEGRMNPKSEFPNTTYNGLNFFHQGVTDFRERLPDNVHGSYCKFTGGEICRKIRGYSFQQSEAPVGRLNLTDRKIIIGRGLSTIRNLDGYQCFTFHQLKEIFTEEDIMGSEGQF